MIFANQSLVEMLRSYSVFVGGSTPESEAALFADLKHTANLVEPGSITSDSMTAYEAFLEVEKRTVRNVTQFPQLDVAGYDDTVIDLSTWDPLAPVDDTDQYPGGECNTSWRELRYKNTTDSAIDDVADDITKLSLK